MKKLNTVLTALLFLALCFITSNSNAQIFKNIKEKINNMKEKAHDKAQFGGKESTLQDKVIKEIAMISSEKPMLVPGGSVDIGMIATLEDGTQMKTVGLADGKTKWGNYVVTVTGGSFSGGTVNITSDPRRIKGGKVSVTVALFQDSTRFKTMDFDIGFKANYSANYSGRNGENGQEGSKGQDGQKGQDNTDGNGSDGQQGSPGGDGGQGGNGENGDVVDVYMTAFKGNKGEALVKVYVTSRTTNHENFYVIDPDGGSLTIYANGGSGGSGGAGGRGGSGGCGGKGHSYGGNTSDPKRGVGGNGGNGANGGTGGTGGNGGNGGSVTIHADASAQAYTGIIKCVNQGGGVGSPGSAGGAGGYGCQGYADKDGKPGSYGSQGKTGSFGQRSGKQGPAPLVVKEAVQIDWDKVGTGN